MASIQLDRVTKVFGDLHAVKDVSLAIEDGEFVAILGPSGCGKTTTLNMIVGLERPTEGRVLFDGQVVNEVPPERRNIGMVFQDYAIFPHMTVGDNLAFGLKIKNVPKAKIREEVDRIAKILDLEDVLSRKVTGLNLGQIQRAALGRTLVTQPAVILFDEPLSNLEAYHRERMRTELKTLQKQLNYTAIYVTHDQAEAMSLADRVAIMRQGDLQQYSSPLEVYDRPRNLFVAGFVGSPPMNLVRSRLVHEDGSARLEGAGFSLDVSNLRGHGLPEERERELWLGVRPERIRVGPPEEALILEPVATIYAVEPLGSETLVDLKVGEEIFRAMASASFMGTIGDELRISFGPHELHLFDAESGNALMNGTGD